ncbi:hypothetical protein O4J56_26690 [Nocardiopsis sp. RSe5-2]|uniref:Uncharacterized protein n=1 Tax=Nocardiopsis endophytica TaxID=3018445 RepID=A0ABT4UD38_9ACTN|nr:hypothetical protein [Nocardiopsis endophytica]MDA2814265.1 hypothetical protein [Nocardiopsis endophytica]
MFDAHGEPVQGVAIEREYTGDELIHIEEYGVVSGADGGWSLSLEPGEWDITGVRQEEETSTEHVVAEGESVEGVDLYFP